MNYVNKKDFNITPLYSANFSNLEYNKGLRAWLNFIIIPILNLIPSSARKLIVKDEAANKVIDRKTSHYALEILYQRGANIGKPKNFIESFSRKLWFDTNNAKAVRNRLKIVKFLLFNEIKRQSKLKAELNILSIASGSARAVFESVKAFLDYDDSGKININIFLTDKSEDAINYSKNLANEYLMHEYTSVNISWLQHEALEVLGKFKSTDVKFDLVELVGLLDYFNYEDALKLVSEINKILKSDSALITANIQENKEMEFVSKFVDWHMVYKSSSQMYDLAVSAGFDKENIFIINEPFNIHTIVLAKK